MSEATALKRQDFDKGFFIVESESCFYITNERKAYKNFGGIKNALKEASSSSGRDGINFRLQAESIEFDKFCPVIDYLHDVCRYESFNGRFSY